MKPYLPKQPVLSGGVLNRANASFALVAMVVIVISASPLWLWVPATLVGNIGLALTCTALLCLPGLALIRTLWKSPLSIDERLPLALSLSCVIPPLILLASDIVSMRWNSTMAWAALAVCAVIAFWPRPRPVRPTWQIQPTYVALLLISGASLAVRLYTTRNLVMGQFGDSVHHTIIAQLLVDNGGLFHSWQPYAQLTTLTYHYGFHSIVAWLSWLSSLEVRLSLLVVGQVESALAAPLMYLLTRRLGGSRPAALWAALIAGLLMTVPSYYASWGRYTQLGGQTVLVSVGIAWAALLEHSVDHEVRWPTLASQGLLTALATAGLALTHYRVAIFAICFVLAYTIMLLIAQVRSAQAFGRLAGAGMTTGALAIILVMPWILRLREGKLLEIGGHFMGRNIGSEGTNIFPTTIIEMVAPWPLAALAIVGVGLLVWRRQWRGLVLPLWAGLIWLAANPYLLGFNGAGLITNFAVLIASYLLLAPLAGIALGQLGDWAGQLAWGRYLAPALGVALAAWGLTWQPTNIDPANELVRPADLAAMSWIAANTPHEARLFVNSFPAYGNTLYAGSDGGWMLTFFSGRETNLPPITYGSEAAVTPNYWAQVNAENNSILSHPIDSPAATAALKAAGFSYLYDGPAASPGNEYLAAAKIDASPLYERVYHESGVTIWRIR
jgi:hypothetical protein